MKNIFKFIFASVLALGLASCEEKMNMDLEIPGDVTLTTVQYASSVQQGDLTLFTVSLTGESGKAAIVFVGDGLELAAGTYTPAASTDAKKGNYVLGVTSVNGFLVESGDIVVTAGGIEGNVVCEGKNVHFKYSGTLPKFEQTTAEVVALTVVKEAKHNLPDSATVILQLATADEANYLSLELYSKDGLLPAGVYTPGAAPAAGTFVIGHDEDETAKDLGTCWWTVKDGVATAQKITAGTVYVETTDETNYVITLRSDDLVAVFTGELALVKYQKPTTGPLPEPSYTGEDTVTPGNGFDTHTIVLKDPAGNVVAQFAVLTESGAESFVGDYTVQSSAAAPGLMGDGWSSDGGVTVNGSYLIEEGVTYMLVQDWFGGTTVTVSITRAENGRYTFSGNPIISTKPDYTFTGPTSFSFENVSFGDEPAQDGEEEFDGVEYTKLIGFMDYTSWGQPMIALNLVTDGVEGTYEWWQLTATGSGSMLQLEIYAEGGVLAAGTYEAAVLGQMDAIAEGQFKAGYDGGGSSWSTITDGTASAGGLIADGTVTVELDGDTYTITVESSEYKARYIGPVAPLS